MAKDKKNRKSSRHFNLEKPVERVFEIEKDVDLIDVAPTKPEASKPQLATPIAPSKGLENVKKPSSSPKVEDTKMPKEATSSYNSIICPFSGRSTLSSSYQRLIATFLFACLI
jgi:hypothetical protein